MSHWPHRPVLVNTGEQCWNLQVVAFGGLAHGHVRSFRSGCSSLLLGLTEDRSFVQQNCSCAASLVAIDMCLFFSFQGRTSRSCRLPDGSASRALQGEGASILPRGSPCASSQRGLPPPPGSEGCGSPVSPVLPTPSGPPVQRTLPTRRSAFAPSAPPSARLSGNGQTRAPRGQPRPVPLPNPGSPAEEPHDRSCVAGHHQERRSPGRRTSDITLP